MTKTKLIGGVIAAAALFGPALAAAQEGVQPQDDLPPIVQGNPFDPLGIRAGAFLIFPSIATDAAYDDNVFADDTDEQDDFIFTLRPEVSAESQWSRHSLIASAFGEFGFFASENDSNYEDFGTALTGRLDVTRDSATSSRLAISRLHEDRDSPDDLQEEDVTQYWIYQADLAHRHNFARFFIQPKALARRDNFESAGDFNNSERDRNRYGLGLRGGVTVSPRINVFAEVDGDVVRYDDSGATNRDSEGYEVLGGVEVDISRLVIGEASVGYAYREYEDDDLDEVDGLAANLGIAWTPTQLTTVNFTGSAGIDETTVVFEGDEASGNFATRVGIDVDHELRRNIILNASGAYERDDFEGTSRTDDTFRLGAGVSYLLNRNLSVNAGYNFTTRSSDSDTSEFDRNVFRIGLTARL